MITYLLVGVVFYLAMFAFNHETFQDATLVSLVRGFVLGILFWPIVMWLVYWDWVGRE